MKLILKILLCLSILPLSVFCQERIQKFAVGPYDGKTRIILSFIEPTDEGFNMRSMIIDMDPIKNGNEQPKSVFVDLTSTVRQLSTGKKDQKILLIRWNKNEEIELKCDGNWTKQDSDSAAQMIVDTTKSIIQSIPLNKKEPTEIKLSDETIKKIEAVFDSMKPENHSCLRVVN